MERVLRLAERAARSSSPVLIEGERGVGKELLARAVHGSSGRRGRGFVMLSGEPLASWRLKSPCPRLRRSNPEGGPHLQRQRRHALTWTRSARSRQPRRHRLAAFFEMRDRHAAPGERSQRNDICVIAAASYPLIDLVSAGRFREDLFYRLSVTPIWLPPLRERRAEIPDLARRILARLGAEEVRSGIFGISPAAIDLLSAYDWPGNFRELENAIFRAVLLCEGSELSPLDFPQLVTPSGNGLLPDGSSCPTATARSAAAHPEQAGERKAACPGSRADRRIRRTIWCRQASGRSAARCGRSGCSRRRSSVSRSTTIGAR